MSNRRADRDYESEDLLMNDDFDLVDDDNDEELQEERSARARSFNMDMRHRIEDRLEERRLKRELSEYEFLDFDDDDTLH